MLDKLRYCASKVKKSAPLVCSFRLISLFFQFSHVSNKPCGYMVCYATTDAAL